MPSTSADVWASGAAYELYIGRWSRRVAPAFLTWLQCVPDASWLDVGCGTGALTEAIFGAAAPARVHAIDASPSYAQFARGQVRDRRATFVVADARSLPCAAHSIDIAVSGLALNFVPQPHEALAEMARVVRTGGVVAVYVWDYAGEMQLVRSFWDAAVSLDPRASQLDEARRFPICRPAALEELFRRAGLEGIESVAIDVPTRFRDFDDYWHPFLGGQGPAPGYAMSLTEDRRIALREHILASLPFGADGSINLIARAWAARGTRA